MKTLLRDSYFCFLVLLLLAACGNVRAQGGSWGPGAGAKPTYSVVYTGRMFGYFRYPDVQRSDQQGCPAVDSVPMPPAVAAYRKTLQELQPEGGTPEVLVSMGDNFAPELLARDMQDEEHHSRHQGSMIRKDLFTADPNGTSWWLDEPGADGSTRTMPENKGTIPSDNVGCFLRLMGFQAIVPGEQDFYFGPERLRQLARFLAAPGKAPYTPVQMLAANLTIVTTPHTPPEPLPAGTLPVDLQRALRASNAVKIEVPEHIMPWLQSVRVTEAAGGTPRVYDCPASADDPKRFVLPEENRSHCVALTSDGADRFRFDKPAQPSANFLAQYYALDPGSNHALCAVFDAQGKSQTHCQLFSVQYPFFQYRPQTSGTSPAPYALINQLSNQSNSQNPAVGHGVAVFGVMDPSLTRVVGQLEGSWRNEDRRYDSAIAIIDPVEALRQVLGLCAADPQCQGRRKILLAQMPYYKAATLASKFTAFDLVISQPDGEHANGEEYSSKTVREEAGGAAYLLSPGLTFDSNRTTSLSTNLRRADFYSAEDYADRKREFLANRVFDTPLPAPAEDQKCEGCAYTAAVTRAAGTDYGTLALTAMQQFCGSDVALLQDRDLFTGFAKAVELWPRHESYTVQEILDEVLWKGDFVFCLPVQGSTLKKVLADSAAFAKQDTDNLSPAVDKGRALTTLGIQTDPGSGVPLIRGQTVDDGKLYGVAMTDYLAFGNTGYTEFASEAVPPLLRVTALKRLARLTGLACADLPATLTKGSCQTEQISAADYFDALRQRPFDTSRGLTAWIELRQWATHPLQPQPVTGTLFENRGQSPETKVENRAMWWFTLQNVSLEYHLSFIGGSDKTVPGNFSGINSFSQLSTAESSAVGLWTRARGGYSFPKYVDFYASGEMKYARSAIRNSAQNGNFGPYQLTLNSNLVRGEIGILTKPFTRTVPVRALVSENVFTQATEPFEQFNVPVACGTAPCVGGATSLTTFALGKNFLVMSRIGGRLQNARSWFEGGREYGENIGTPVGYTLQDVGSNPFSCALAGNRSLSGCVASDPAFTSQSRILPDLRNQYVAGWFMNFHALAPLYRSKVQLAVDSYGEVFDRERDDTGFNTRYYEDFSLSLRVPLWGNLLFAPQVEAFYYQNKVVPRQPIETNHYVFVTTSVKLEYGFDWHRGLGVIRALRYPSGVVTSASAGAPVP